jgi:hypothetical protein
MNLYRNEIMADFGRVDQKSHCPAKRVVLANCLQPGVARTTAMPFCSHARHGGNGQHFNVFNIIAGGRGSDA